MGSADIDELFAARFAEGVTPGLVYAVVERGAVTRSGAFGTVSPERDGPPTVDSVFRIASMSKSFTAAAVLLLRDRGQLRLDDPAAAYVTELADRTITVRSLLTMSAGLLTDDPWGDRQESLSDDEFGALLADGFTVGREPGLGFEYSNMGYAVLGRVITNVAAGTTASYREFVERELLAPLGMTATRYAWSDVGPALVTGYVKRDTGWVALDPVEPGAFSAMGGLHSSVRDLARWVDGFVSAFDEAPDGHPLSKASRREMQQLQRLASVDATLGGPAGLRAVGHGYGCGLFVSHDSQLGQFAMHSGGYPGYGSRMAWHAASGLGVITLSNASYAGAYQQADDALRRLVRNRDVTPPGPRLAVTGDWLTRVTARLGAFDPDRPWIDDALMAGNVALDTPDHERRQRIVEARDRVGAPLPHGLGEPFSRAMAHASWIVPAERGRYELEILLTPEARPRLQTITVNGVPRAPAGAVDRVLTTLDEPSAGLLRAFGEPALVAEPVSSTTSATEFLVEAGATWWKATLTDDGVTFEPHPAAAYPRLEWLSRQLRALAAPA